MMEPDNTETPESEDQELSFLEHLVELRSRLLKACFAVIVVLVALLESSFSTARRALAPLGPGIAARLRAADTDIILPPTSILPPLSSCSR